MNLEAKLLKACQDGDSQGVLDLLDHGVDVDIRDRQGYSPLYLAVREGDLDIVTLLLEHGADPNALARNQEGLGPLHEAIREENVEMVKLLLEHGADVNKANDGDLGLEVQGLFEEEMSKERKKIVLDENFEGFPEEPEGVSLAPPLSPLEWAFETKNQEILRALILAGANIEPRKWSCTLSPIMLAARDGLLDTFGLLLERGASVNQQDPTGKIALDWAKENGHTKILKAFFSQCKDLRLYEIRFPEMTREERRKRAKAFVDKNIQDLELPM